MSIFWVNLERGHQAGGHQTNLKPNQIGLYGMISYTKYEVI